MLGRVSFVHRMWLADTWSPALQTSVPKAKQRCSTNTSTPAVCGSAAQDTTIQDGGGRLRVETLWNLGRERLGGDRPARVQRPPCWQNQGKQPLTQPFGEWLLPTLWAPSLHSLITEHNFPLLLNQTWSRSVGSNDSKQKDPYWGPTQEGWLP